MAGSSATDRESRTASDRPEPVPENLHQSARARYEEIQQHTAERERLFAVSTKLNRKTRIAIEVYESLQRWSEAEQRDSVSRLLGIDLYV
ncbi:MAG: hypothetical protein ACU843_18865 [Gammaproteobacteria bacterium]